MAVKTYIGDSGGIAREIKKLYIGDANGIARELKKLYAGDSNGIARKIYEKESSTVVTLPTANWTNLVFGNGKFVAVSNTSKQAVYSLDGKLWNSTTTVHNVNGQLVFGNGIFAASSGSYFNRSTDGISWSASVPATLTNYTSYQGLVYDGTKFILLDAMANKKCFTSTDAITWNSYTFSFTGGYNQIAYGNGVYVSPCYNTNSVAYSSNGTSWSSGTLPSTSYWGGVAYGNGVFVAIGGANKMTDAVGAYSSNGKTWTSSVMPVTGAKFHIRFLNGKFICPIYNTDKVLTSTNGVTWNTVTLPVSGYWRDVAYGNSKYVFLSGASTAGTDSKVLVMDDIGG